MSLSSLLFGRILPAKGEAFPRHDYMDYAGRACVSSMGIAALAVILVAFYLSPAGHLGAMLVLVPVLWLILAVMIILTIVAHTRRLRALGFGTAYIVFFVLDIVLTRLFFMGTTIYLGFKKSDDEKQAPGRLTGYGKLWFAFVILNAFLMVASPVSVLLVAGYMAHHEQTANSDQPQTKE